MGAYGFGQCEHGVLHGNLTASIWLPSIAGWIDQMGNEHTRLLWAKMRCIGKGRALEGVIHSCRESNKEL
jgi:hypothetical protein